MLSLGVPQPQASTLHRLCLPPLLHTPSDRLGTLKSLQAPPFPLKFLFRVVYLPAASTECEPRRTVTKIHLGPWRLSSSTQAGQEHRPSPPLRLTPRPPTVSKCRVETCDPDRQGAGQVSVVTSCGRVIYCHPSCLHLTVCKVFHALMLLQPLQQPCQWPSMPPFHARASRGSAKQPGAPGSTQLLQLLQD